MPYENEIARQSAHAPLQNQGVAVTKLPAPSFAFQKAQERLSKHFEPYLPQGAQDAVARLAVFDHISKNRDSILRHGAQEGSEHHTAVKSILDAHGIGGSIPPKIITTGARLFSAREQATDRFMLQDNRGLSAASADAAVRDIEHSRQKLRNILLPEMPKGPAMASARQQTLQAISDNRRTIAQSGAPVGSDACNTVWQPINSIRLADPKEYGTSASNGKGHAQRAPERKFHEFTFDLAGARQRRMEQTRAAAQAAPKAAPDTGVKYPLISPENIRKAAYALIEREQLANSALAGVAKARDEHSVSSAGSNIFDDPKLAAMDKDAQRSIRSTALDNTQSDYANGRILAQPLTGSSATLRPSPEHKLPVRTPDLLPGATVSSEPQRGGAPSSLNDESRISSDPRLRASSSSGHYDCIRPLTMETLRTHTVGTDRRGSTSQLDQVPGTVSNGSFTGTNRDRGSNTSLQLDLRELLHDSIAAYSSEGSIGISARKSAGAGVSGSSHVSQAQGSAVNTAEQLLQEEFARLPSLSIAAQGHQSSPLLREADIPNRQIELHGTLVPSTTNSGISNKVDYRSDRQTESSNASVSVRSSQIPSVPSSFSERASALEALRENGSDNARVSDKDSSGASLREKRARSETSGDERGKKRARSVSTESSGSRGSSQGLLASQAEEVSDQRISEVSTEKEGSVRSRSWGSHSKESSDSWVSGASSDPEWVPQSQGAIGRAEQRLMRQAAAVPVAALRREAREQLDLPLTRAAMEPSDNPSGRSSQSSGYVASHSTSSDSGSDKSSSQESSSLQSSSLQSSSRQSASQRSVSQQSAARDNQAENVSSSAHSSRSSGSMSGSRSGLVESQAIEDNRSYKSSSMENPSHYSSVGSDGWRSGSSSADGSYKPSASQLRRVNEGASVSSSQSSSAASGGTSDSSRNASIKVGRPDRPEREHRSRGGRV